jgi:hypothetical protein
VKQHEKRELTRITTAYKAGVCDRDTAARGISALVRAAGSRTARTELCDAAIKLGVVWSPAWNVGEVTA